MEEAEQSSKRQATEKESYHDKFRNGLFDPAILEEYQDSYALSYP